MVSYWQHTAFPVRCELYIYVHYILIIVLNGKNTQNKIQGRQYKRLKLDDCGALDLSGNWIALICFVSSNLDRQAHCSRCTWSDQHVGHQTRSKFLQWRRQKSTTSAMTWLAAYFPLFWYGAQRERVVCHRRFGTPCRSPFQGSRYPAELNYDAAKV
jgi:hypothetical protein